MKRTAILAGVCGLMILAFWVTNAWAGAPAAPAGPSPSAPSRTSLWELIKAGGFVSIFIWLCSAILVALAIENYLSLRRKSIMPAELIEGFNANLRERKYQEAFEVASRSDSFLGRVLTAGLSKLPLGYQAAVQHMLETGEEETIRLEQKIGYLSLVGVIAPMLGLLGTVTGMVGAFMQIHHLQEAVKPGDMAQGVYEALVTTVEGLVVAIPAIALYSVYRNRVQRLVLEVGLVSEEMMSQFNPATRRAGGVSTAASATVAAAGAPGGAAATPAAAAPPPAPAPDAAKKTE